MSDAAVHRAAVVGAGAWGTTFACLLAEAGTPTTLWARRTDLVREINAGRNERYVPPAHGCASVPVCASGPLCSPASGREPSSMSGPGCGAGSGLRTPCRFLPGSPS